MDLKSDLNFIDATLLNNLPEANACLKLYSDGGSRREQKIAPIGYAIILFQKHANGYTRRPLIAGARFFDEFKTSFHMEMQALLHILSLFNQLFNNRVT